MTQLPLFPEEPVQPSDQLVPGTLVLCRYRLPHTLQPWIARFHVGVVEAPSDDPAQWNDRISERQYCEKYKRARIRYDFGVQHEDIGSLIPITSEQAALSHREKIALFLGDEALRNYDCPPHSKGG
jgi:hypothetical protein